MKIIIFGTGQYYKQNIEKLSNFEIAALLDNDVSKQGQLLDGYFIDNPNYVSKYEYDYIIILAKCYKEIRQQLVDLGIAEDRIIDKEHKAIFERVRRVQRYEIIDTKVSLRKIALVTHDLSLTGAPIALFHLAKLLKKLGYGVEIFSLANGPLQYEFVKERIGVTVFDYFEFEESEIDFYFEKYEKVIVNSVVLLPFVINICGRKKVMWWLHDSPIIYQGMEKILYKSCDVITKCKDISVYAVSNVAARNFKQYIPDKEVKVLAYGIPDVLYDKRNRIMIEKKIIFAVIGTAHEIKGYDIFMDAIRVMDKQQKNKAEFWFVGSLGTEALEKEIVEFTEGEPTVKVVGELSRQRMTHLYEEIDVIVNPSRQDALPTVVAEGMMHGKVCITSNVTGMADYIITMKNGLICQSDDVKHLSEQMEWIIKNPDKMNSIGVKARRTYEEFFSMEAFEKNVKEILADVE